MVDPEYAHNVQVQNLSDRHPVHIQVLIQEAIIIELMIGLVQDIFEHFLDGLSDLRDPGREDLLRVIFPVKLQCKQEFVTIHHKIYIRRYHICFVLREQVS